MYEDGSQMEFTREAPPSDMLSGPGKRILWCWVSSMNHLCGLRSVDVVAIEISLFAIQGGVGIYLSLGGWLHLVSLISKQNFYIRAAAFGTLLHSCALCLPVFIVWALLTTDSVTSGRLTRAGVCVYFIHLTFPDLGGVPPEVCTIHIWSVPYLASH